MSAPAARTVMTSAVANWAALDEDRLTFIATCISRHLAGDWGDVDTEDWAANDRAVRMRCGRVLSSFRPPSGLTRSLGDSRLWVITDDLEDPDTATTVLWPSEY